MSYYFWLGHDSCEIERHRECQQESRDYMKSIFEAYGYEEPQAGTEAINLTDSNSSTHVRDAVDLEADGFVTVHPELRNSPLDS
jgi:hypothetical protein